MVHPGVLIGQSQLDFMKQQSNAGVEPFASAYKKAKASSWGSLTYVPQGPPSGGAIDCGSYSKPNTGCTLEDNDSTAALTQALLWYISGNSQYAKNAIAIMNAYAKGLTSGHTNSNAPVQTGWASQNFPAAAEIIRYSNAGWLDADFAAFKNLMVNSYLPNMADSGLTNKNGNWGLGALSGRLGIAVLSDNQALFDATLVEFNQAVPAYFYSSADGSTPKTSPIISSKWNGQSVFDSSSNGVSQETCRDLQHMQFGMAWTFNFMETALIQGTDLYAPLQSRMIPVLELHASLFPPGFNDMSPSGSKVASPASICGGTVAAVLNPTFEIAYNGYANRRGVPLPKTLAHLTDVRAIAFTGGNSALNHGMTFETLHHGGAPGNTPSSSPAPSPSPTPIPTPSPIGTCQVSIDVKKQKQIGAVYQAELRIKVSSSNSVPTPWILELDNLSYTDVVKSMGWSPTIILRGIVGGGSLKALGSKAIKLRVTIQGSSPALAPIQASVNGVVCN